MVVHFVTRHVDPDVTVVDFTGQLTLGNKLMEAEHTIRELIRQGSKKLVLDLTKLTFLDSAGVGVLAVCSGAMTKAGGRLLIAGASGRVKEVLQLTRLDQVIGMVSDVASACSAFA